MRRFFRLLTIFNPLIRAIALLSIVIWILCMIDLLLLNHFRRAVYIIPVIWVGWSIYKFYKGRKKTLDYIF